MDDIMISGRVKMSVRILLLVYTTIIELSFGSQAQSIDDPKTLIVYLSRTRNTEVLAEIIHEKVGGKLVEIILETPYPEDYNAIVEQVQRENENGYLPALETKFPDIDRYTTVFIGYPTWGMQLPPPMKSFLHNYDLRGKTMIPFNTHAGYGPGNSFDTIRRICPDSRILKGLSIKGGVERDGFYLALKDEKVRHAEEEVMKWLNEIGMAEAR
jgi:flavodoxin